MIFLKTRDSLSRIYRGISGISNTGTGGGGIHVNVFVFSGMGILSNHFECFHHKDAAKNFAIPSAIRFQRRPRIDVDEWGRVLRNFRN